MSFGLAQQAFKKAPASKSENGRLIVLNPINQTPSVEEMIESGKFYIVIDIISACKSSVEIKDRISKLNLVITEESWRRLTDTINNIDPFEEK